VSRRTERIASLVRTIVADAIQNRLSDPRIEPLTSVTRVEISPDMSLARVFISVMAPEVRQELTLKALRHASGRLRKYLAEGLTLRLTPAVEFRLDDSLQQSFRTVQELDRIMEELGERGDGEMSSENGSPDAEETFVEGTTSPGEGASSGRRSQEDC